MFQTFSIQDLINSPPHCEVDTMISAHFTDAEMEAGEMRKEVTQLLLVEPKFKFRSL